MSLAAGLLLAVALALVLTPLVIVRAGRLAALDRPGDGKLHREPVPTLGGLAVVAAVLGTLWGFHSVGRGLVSPHSLVAVSVAWLPVIAVALADDLGCRSIALKLSGHLLAGLGLFAYGFRVTELTSPIGDALPLGLLSLPVTLLWVVMVVNAMNLVDGLDGLAGGIGAIAALTLSLVGLLQSERDVHALGLVLGGAILGFYPYNFPRARVFLGDVGSTSIGFVLAAIALLQNRKATAAMTLLLPLVVLGLPVLDTAFAVVRRTATGKNPLRRDLGHLHHRLLRLGLTTQAAVGLLLVVTAAFGGVAVLLSQLPKRAALSTVAILGVGSLIAVARLLQMERRAERANPRELGLMPPGVSAPTRG